MAFIQPSQRGVANIWLKTIGKNDASMLSNDTGRGIYSCSWSTDGKYLMYIGDWNGDENFHLYSIDVKSKLTRDLTPFKGVRAQNFQVNAAKPNEVLVELNIIRKIRGQAGSAPGEAGAFQWV
jgi:hypothetical protein